MVSGLTLKSSTHFEFIFLYGIRRWFSSIPLHVHVQFSQYYWLKKTVFTTVYSCFLCQRLIDHIYVWSYVLSLLCSVDLWVLFCASATLFWLLYLCNVGWSQGAWCLQLCFFSRLLSLLGGFCGSKQILGLFVLVLWKMPFVFW